MASEITVKDETGSVDLLIFVSENRKYAINVSKVQEIVGFTPLTAVPRTNPCVEGVFMPREELIPVLDMKRVLGHGESGSEGSIIIACFSTQTIAFHVDAIDGILTTAWRDIMEPSKSFGDGENGIATGIVKHNNDLIVILDFEKIVSDINPEMEQRFLALSEREGKDRKDIPILIAEDSVLLNRLIVEALEKAGYSNITHTANGLEAWELIKKWQDEGTLDANIRCLITDIEMPKMDGHSLIKHMKENPETKTIKIVIFSSMINDAERAKGEKLGADEQLSKPEIDLLVQKMDQMFEK